MNEAMLRQLLWISIVTSARLATGYVAHPDFDQCDRPQCYVIDDIFMNNIKSHLEPCQDFFRYACGKNDSRRSSYVSFMANEAYTETPKMQDLEEIVSGSVSLNSEENSIDALRIEREIYQKCQRVGTYTEEAKENYKRLLKKSLGQLDTNEHWSNIDKKFASEGLGFAFFDIDIVQYENPYNRELHRYIQISPPTDNVMDMNDLLTSRYMDKLQYNTQNRDIFSGYNMNVNINNDYATEAKYMELKKFINEFNKVLPYEKFDDSFFRDDIIPKPISILEWQRKWNENALHVHSKINWRNILDSLFSKIDKRIYEDEQIIIINEQYFHRLIELLRMTTNINTIVDYINLRFVSKTIGSVIEEYKDKYSIVPPIKGLACTPGLLVGAAHIYARQYFPRDNKETVEGIFTVIRSIIEKQLGSDNYNLQATSDITKNFLRQLSGSNVLIGHPDWLYNERFIRNFYGSRMAISEIYHVNQLRLMEVLLKHKLRAYTDANLPLIDIKLFFKSFIDENISFLKYPKHIILPVRVFSENNFKFVSTQLYEPINYGAAGTVIASELYSVWLRRIAYDQNATQCIRHQMPANTNKNGPNDYLLKSTAYLLGLRTAFEAWPSKDSYPIQFPKFGAITDYRLFFLAFAESLCIGKEQRSEFQPYEFINFAVSNMDEFSDAFQCYKNHRMNRHHKCDPLKY